MVFVLTDESEGGVGLGGFVDSEVCLYCLWGVDEWHVVVLEVARLCEMLWGQVTDGKTLVV